MDIQENDCSCNRDNSIEKETRLNKNKANGNSLNTIGSTYIITKKFLQFICEDICNSHNNSIKKFGSEKS